MLTLWGRAGAQGIADNRIRPYGAPQRMNEERALLAGSRRFQPGANDRLRVRWQWVDRDLRPHR